MTLKLGLEIKRVCIKNGDEYIAVEINEKYYFNKITGCKKIVSVKKYYRNFIGNQVKILKRNKHVNKK